MDLENKVAVVTGASKGIGRAIALKFASEGATVFVNYNTSKTEAEDVVRQIQNLGRVAYPLQADVGTLEGVEKIEDVVLNHYAKADILVNNASIYPRTNLFYVDDNYWNKVLDTNLKGLFFLTQKFGQHMITQKNGVIINIASAAGMSPTHLDGVVYGATKAATIHLTKSFAKVFAPYVRVNSISPGYTYSEMQGFEKNPQKEQRVLSEIPLNLINQPEDIAEIAAFLASSKSRTITGENILVDGGRILK